MREFVSKPLTEFYVFLPVVRTADALGAIYEQAFVKSEAGIVAGAPNHLFGIPPRGDARQRYTSRPHSC